MNKWILVLLIIVIILVATAGGVIYWSLRKVKNITGSAVDSSKNIKTVLTPTSSDSAPSQTVTPKPTLTIPSLAVEGTDIPDVPPYINSVRSTYDNLDNGKNINLEYFAQTSRKDLFQYFKTNLLEKGWVLRAEDESALNFSKSSNADSDVSIEVIDEDINQNIIQYGIHYFVIEDSEEGTSQ